MRKILLSFLKQILFWIMFFNFTRLIFIIYYAGILRAEQIPFSEIPGVFYHSFRLDLATACYIMIIPFLLLALQTFWRLDRLNAFIRVYHNIVIAGYSLTAAGEMGIYAEWKTKLTYKVIKYLANPGEIYNSAETGTFFLLLTILLMMATAGILAYGRFFHTSSVPEKRNPWQAAVFTILMPGFLFVGLRGGVQQIPINQSESYYSGYNILNIAAVNNGFNLYISIFENLKNFDRNPYRFMEPRVADSIMKQIYRTPPPDTTCIFATDRPNVVLIILESWSADLIESLGGEPGITPEFRKLERNGILFDRVYASGARSEQGMASIFGGFPSHPISSITVQPDKFVKLPSLVMDLKKAGYSSSFYFGGQLIYGNIKSYIFFNGFDRITEGKDFPDSLPEGKLGIHDQFTLGYMLSDISTMKQPFFASLFTLSTHSPWDQPFEKPLTWGDNEREYINAAYYTDHCLGEFFRAAAQQTWYANTLFILVADHSHNSYRNWHPYTKEYHRIPLLLTGEVIQPGYRGQVWHKTGNQHDIAATLLRQLNLPSEAYRFSKDLFNPAVPDFAYYSTEDGLGWITPGGYFTWDAGPDYYYWWSDPDLPEKVKNEGKAYLQTVFGEYLSK